MGERRSYLSLASAVHCDDRPRIHLWQHSLTGHVRWSLGPMTFRSRETFATAGGALDAALDHIGGRAAVIVFEGKIGG